jgi:beta-galactosidase
VKSAPSNVTATSATLTLRGDVYNGDTSARDIEVQTTVVGADQTVLVVLDTIVHAEAQSSVPVSIQASIANPHLWQGRDDPYVYTTYTVVSTGGQARDMIVQPLGFRSVRVDADQGFFLNENYLDLHGVNRHQDLLDHGWAMMTTATSASSRRSVQPPSDLPITNITNTFTI